MIIWNALFIAVLINFVMFIFAFRNKTDKFTDISYVVTFFILLMYGLLISGASTFYEWILAFMITVWAVRLGIFLFVRIQKAGKDRRFDKIRSNFNKFLTFWLLQAVTVWVVMLGPIEFFTRNEKPITVFVVLGVCIWLIGLLLETIADWQKYEFTQNPKNKNKWISTGLWKYSRHPNYFGEILVWFGIYVFVVSALEGTSQYISMISPLFIMFMLLFVTGVPILEKSADAKWGKDKKYQNYKKSTSIIVPAPPKS